MADRDTMTLLDTAQMLRADAKRIRVSFLHSELDLSKTFAEKAWVLCLEGQLPEAKMLALLPSTHIGLREVRHKTRDDR